MKLSPRALDALHTESRPVGHRYRSAFFLQSSMYIQVLKFESSTLSIREIPVGIFQLPQDSVSSQPRPRRPTRKAVVVNVHVHTAPEHRYCHLSRVDLAAMISTLRMLLLSPLLVRLAILILRFRKLFAFESHPDPPCLH